MLLLINEIVISFILGGIPTIFLYKKGGINLALESLSALNLGEKLFYLYIGFLIAHVLIFLITKKTILYLNDNINSISSWLLNITHQIAFSFQGIFRLINGSITVIFCTVLINEGITIPIWQIVIITLFWFALILASRFLSELSIKTKV